MMVTEEEIDDYIAGWKETHPDETLSREVARDCCIDSEHDMKTEEETENGK